MRKTLVTIASLAMVAAPVAAGGQAGAIDQQVINAPGLGNLSISGLQSKPRVRADKGVQGGQAMRIAIPAADTEAWKISLGTPITRPVKKGDRILVVFSARAETPPDGADSIALPFNAVQLGHDPWTPLFHASAVIGTDWNIYHIDGRADRDYGAGDLMVSMHLASGRQVIDFGPVIVLDLGLRT